MTLQNHPPKDHQWFVDFMNAAADVLSLSKEQPILYFQHLADGTVLITCKLDMRGKLLYVNYL